MTYKKTHDGGVIHPDGYSISPENIREWARYQKFLDQGGQPEDADPPPEDFSRKVIDDAKMWFKNNPNARQIFTLSDNDLLTEISTHVDNLFPSASAQIRNKEKVYRMATTQALRVLVKQFFLDRDN